MKKLLKTSNAGKIFPKEPERRKKIYIISSFILLSVFLWLIIKLSHENEARFNLQITVVNTPADFIIKRMSHDKIAVNLRAGGARLLYTQLVGQPRLIELDFSQFNAIEKNGIFLYYITNRQLALNLPSFYEESQILSVKPDTLFLEIKKTPE